MPPFLAPRSCGTSPPVILSLSPWLPHSELWSVHSSPGTHGQQTPTPPTWVLWLNYELNYVLSGSAVHCPFPKVKPKHFPFLLAQLRFVWRFPAHRAAHPGSPLLRTNRSQLLRAWHRNFVPWYILYQSVKSQNSLQIQGVVPPTTKKLQQNF